MGGEERSAANFSQVKKEIPVQTRPRLNTTGSQISRHATSNPLPKFWSRCTEKRAIRRGENHEERTFEGTFLPVAFSNMSRALSVIFSLVSRCLAGSILPVYPHNNHNRQYSFFFSFIVSHLPEEIGLFLFFSRLSLRGL